MLTDTRFWVGVVAGLAGLYLYHMWQAKRAASS